MQSVRGNKRIHTSRSRLWMILIVFVPFLGLAGLFGWRMYAGSLPPENSSSARDQYVGSIVISSANHNECRQYRLDNATNKIQDDDKNECTRIGNGQGTRLEAISNGFRNR
jgi:cytoskeletal protein RodZ